MQRKRPSSRFLRIAVLPTCPLCAVHKHPAPASLCPIPQPPHPPSGHSPRNHRRRPRHRQATAKRQGPQPVRLHHLRRRPSAISAASRKFGSRISDRRRPHRLAGDVQQLSGDAETGPRQTSPLLIDSNKLRPARRRPRATRCRAAIVVYPQHPDRRILALRQQTARLCRVSHPTRLTPPRRAHPSHRHRQYKLGGPTKNTRVDRLIWKTHSTRSPPHHVSPIKGRKNLLWFHPRACPSCSLSRRCATPFPTRWNLKFIVWRRPQRAGH